MELYIGGYAQGKLEYVLENKKSCIVFDENDFEKALTYEGDETVIFNHFNSWIKRLVMEGRSQEYIEEVLNKSIAAVANKSNDFVIISDEVGCGVVPVDKSDRAYREITGRMLALIAKRADKVVRIVCKIPMRIK